MPHYNAFISYRHAPLDSEVARDIHRQLEHFHVPKAIADRTGIRKIDRLFRDKEELPLTNDLTQDIAQALRDSDYLIVICSPRTNDSIWVQKEIETFLTTHSRNQVLTVLAEGDPGDVIPEILLRTVVTDPATGAENTVLVEPLACDYRVSRHKARREELPRLAAAILGCSYDDLRQRQKMYRMHRLMAAMGAMLALAVAMTAYFIWSNGRIRENYRLALKNQSVYLASESQQALETGDRITAAQLAMAALPQEDSDRPLIPEAELALGRAVGAYAHRRANLFSARLVGRYSNDMWVSNLWLSQDCDLLATVDQGSRLKVWDAETYQELWHIDLNAFYTGEDEPYFSGAFCDIRQLPEDRLLVLDSEELTCYDFRTGAVQWEYRRPSEYLAAPSSCALTPEKDRLLVFYYDELLCLDTAQGQELWQCDYPSYPQEKDKTLTGSDIRLPAENGFSPDGSTLLLAARTGSTSTEEAGLCLDLTDRSWEYLSTPYYKILDGCMLDGETAVILGDADGEDPSTYFAGFSDRYESTVVLSCESTRRDEALWRTELQYYVASLYETVRPSRDGELYCSIANVCCRLDAKTGRILGKNETSSPVIGYVRQNEVGIQSMLRDGSTALYMFDTDLVSSHQLFDGNIQKVRMYRPEDASDSDRIDYFVLREFDSTVQRYLRGEETDESYESLGWEMDNLVRDTFLCGNTLVLSAVDRLYGMDTGTGELLWSLEAEQLGDNGETLMPQVLGPSADGTELFYHGASFGAIDTATGDLEQFQPELPSVLSRNGPVLLKDKLYWLEEDDAFAWQLRIYDIAGEKTDCQPLPQLEEVIYPTLWTACGERLLLRSDELCCLLDPATLELTVVEYDLQAAPAVQDGGQGLLAYIDGYDIVLIDRDGTVAARIATGITMASAAFVPGEDQLLAISTTGQLYVYSTQGQRLAVADLGLTGTSGSIDGARWQFDGGQTVLYLGQDLALSRTLVLDRASWKPEADIDDCFYVRDDRFFCCRVTDDGSFAAAYTRCTPEELLARGRDLVGDTPLQDAEKYGLE